MGHAVQWVTFWWVTRVMDHQTFTHGLRSYSSNCEVSIRIIGVILGGRAGPPLFGVTGRTSHCTSTPSQKFCLVPHFSDQSYANDEDNGQTGADCIVQIKRCNINEYRYSILYGFAKAVKYSEHQCVYMWIVEGEIYVQLLPAKHMDHVGHAYWWITRP